MPSARNPAGKPAATIINATARTRSVIQDLQARLAVEPPRLAERASADESIDDLERQLQVYFERRAPAPANPALEDLRSRVVAAVAERILAQWSANPADPGTQSLRDDVMDRLVARILDEFRKGE